MTIIVILFFILFIFYFLFFEFILLALWKQDTDIGVMYYHCDLNYVYLWVLYQCVS